MGLGMLNPGCTCCEEPIAPCTACDVELFAEDFGSITWPDTWESETCTSGGSRQYQDVDDGFVIDSGKLKSTYPGSGPVAGAARQSIANGDWDCMSLQADVVGNGAFGQNWATVGIYISEARNFLVRHPFSPTRFLGNNFGYSSCGSSNVSFSIGAEPPFGRLLLVIRKVSSGLYDIQYCFDGELKYEELSQSLAFSDPIRFGVNYTFSGAPTSSSDWVTFDNVIFRAH